MGVLSEEDSEEWRADLQERIARLEGMSLAEAFSSSDIDLHRLRRVIAESSEDPSLVSLVLSRGRVSPDLFPVVGEIVVAASRAEEAAGNLLQTLSGSWEERVRGYGDTSNRLLKALKEVVPEELLTRFGDALHRRHFVVHGSFLDNTPYREREGSLPLDFIAMKRTYSADAPKKDVFPFTWDTLRALANEFWALENEFNEVHSDVMLRRGTSAKNES